MALFASVVGMGVCTSLFVCVSLCDYEAVLIDYKVSLWVSVWSDQCKSISPRFFYKIPLPMKTIFSTILMNQNFLMLAEHWCFKELWVLLSGDMEMNTILIDICQSYR